jgi:protein-S-isoprenylcysteine O-methyltransferase
MEVFTHFKQRKLFYSAVLAVPVIYFGIFWISLAGVMFFIDFYERSPLKKAITTIFLTSASLLYIPLFISFYLDLSSTWSISFLSYLASLSLFHLGEFYVQSYFHHQEANFSSNLYSAFLLDHSKEYSIAILFAFLEHFLKLLIPYPVFLPVLFFGISITLTGHIFRIGSEINCGRNFSHKIRFSKQSDHELVTSGFYQ